MVKNPAKLHVYPNWRKKRQFKTPDKTFSILMYNVMHGLPKVLLNNVYWSHDTIEILENLHSFHFIYNLLCVREENDYRQIKFERQKSKHTDDASSGLGRFLPSVATVARAGF